MKKVKRTKEELKEDILRLQIELMENNGYTDEEIKEHEKDAREDKRKRKVE